MPPKSKSKKNPKKPKPKKAPKSRPKQTKIKKQKLNSKTLLKPKPKKKVSFFHRKGKEVEETPPMSNQSLLMYSDDEEPAKPAMSGKGWGTMDFKKKKSKGTRNNCRQEQQPRQPIIEPNQRGEQAQLDRIL